MRCPFCRNADSRVIDSREADDGAGDPPPPVLPGVRPAVHHRRGGRARGRQAQRGHRAVQPGQGHRRRPPGLPGPAGRRGRSSPLLAQRVEEPIRATGAAEVPSHEVGPGHPRPAAGARRGRLPALRQRLPVVHLGRGLREGDRRAQRADGPTAGRPGPRTGDDAGAAAPSSVRPRPAHRTPRTHAAHRQPADPQPSPDRQHATTRESSTP